MNITFRNLSISSKIFAAFSSFFVVLIILTFSVVIFFFNVNSRDALNRELERSSDLAIQVVHSLAKDTIRHHLKAESDTVIKVMDFLQKNGEKRGIPQAGIQNAAAEYLLSLKFGETGYAYVLDESGTILVHPFQEIVGKSVAEYAFVQEQLHVSEGYLEYLWKNPSDDIPQKKVLYTERYAPWGWIVSVSAYKKEFRSLVQINELKETIDNINVGESGYLFILDMKGTFLIHPSLEGINFRSLPAELNQDPSMFDQVLETLNGVTEYEWTDPVTFKKQKKILLYRYIPEFDWIIGSSMNLNDYRSKFRAVNFTLAVIFFVSCLLFLFISRYLSNLLTKPLFNLIQFIDTTAGSDYSGRFSYGGKDELRDLAEHFNKFLDMLQKEKEVRKRAEKRNQVLAQFPEGNPYPVMRVDRNRKILYANPASFDLLEVWGAPENNYLPMELQDKLVDQDERFGNIEYSIMNRYYNILYSHFTDQDAFYLFFQDITDRKENEYQMLMSESVFNNTLEGIAITDPHGLIERVNPAFSMITGYETEEVIGKNPRILKSRHHDREFYEKMWRDIKEQGSWTGEIWNRRKNGEAYPEWLTINSIHDEKGTLIHYVSLFRDISDIKDSEEKLRHQAYHDALTGLPNRLLFMDRLKQAIRQAERGKESLAVLFLDMDNFKTINDSKGHSVGDIFLETIAERLVRSCRQEDTVARQGGDEFTILLPDMQQNRNIVEIVQRIQKETCQPMTILDTEIIPSVSIGVTFFPDDGEDAELLMKNADMAMYKSKQAGRGQYTLYNAQMNEQFQKRLELENKLRRAMQYNEFSLVYQPKVSALDGRVMGAEALIRWHNPNIGHVSPSEFIPLAEESGLILELGDWVLEQALNDMKDFQLSGNQDFEMAVNLSARQFRDKRLIERIGLILDRSGVNRKQVNLEITENIAMEHSDESVEILENLHALGVKISIDDFGTGYSSYSYLKRYRTHTLKIDKSFIDELPGGSRSPAIMKNMIDLGHTLNMEVVAEGVEREDQYFHLKEAGCDIIQGYYFSKPLGKEDFLEYLKK